MGYIKHDFDGEVRRALFEPWMAELMKTGKIELDLDAEGGLDNFRAALIRIMEADRDEQNPRSR